MKIIKHQGLAWMPHALSTLPLIALQCETSGGKNNRTVTLLKRYGI